jgi:hypothetical protein
MEANAGRQAAVFHQRRRRWGAQHRRSVGPVAQHRHRRDRVVMHHDRHGRKCLHLAGSQPNAGPSGPPRPRGMAERCSRTGGAAAGAACPPARTAARAARAAPLLFLRLSISFITCGTTSTRTGPRGSISARGSIDRGLPSTATMLSTGSSNRIPIDRRSICHAFDSCPASAALFGEISERQDTAGIALDHLVHLSTVYP